MKILIWKEWRELRLFVFLAVGIIIITRVLLGLVPVPEPERADFMGGGLLLLCLLFALFLGVIPFNNEFSKKTQSFLLSNPVSAAKIFWTKFLFGLFLFLCLSFLSLAVLCISPPFSGSKLWIDKSGLLSSLLCFVLTYILIYSAAFVASLLVETTLTAILCTPFILIFGMLLAFPLLVVLISTLRFDSGIEDLFLLAICLLLPLLIMFGFMVWRNAISKGIAKSRIIAFCVIATLLVSFGVHGVSDLLGGRELARAIQKARASGVKLTPEEVIPLAVRHFNNAAPIYQEAFVLLEELEAKYEEEWEFIPHVGKVDLEDLTPEQKRISKGLILNNADFLKLYDIVERAVNLPSCRFDLKYEDGPAMLLPHLSKVRQLARLLAARTDMHAEERRYAEALKSAKIGLQLGNSINDEPIFISQLVRIAVDTVAIDSLRSILNIFPEEVSIRDYRELIAMIEGRRGLTKGLEGELAILGDYIFGRMSLASIRMFIESYNSLWLRLFTRIYVSYLGKPIKKRDHGFYIQYLTEGILLSHLPHYKAREDLLRLESEIRRISRKTSHSLSAMLLPALTRSHEQQAKYYARLGGLRIALALKIHKAKTREYPDQLGSLARDIIPELPLDPFTGENYIYRKEGEGFIVYSAGKNLEDDRGIYDKKDPRTGDDIAWRCEE